MGHNESMELLVKKNYICRMMGWGARGMDEENKRQGWFLRLVTGKQETIKDRGKFF